MADLRPEIASALRAFGLDALVTLTPGADAVTTEAFWLPPRTVEVPGGGNRRVEPQRVLVIPLSEVSEVPRGTEVSIAEVRGGTVLDWRVDAIVHHEVDHVRVMVVPA